LTNFKFIGVKLTQVLYGRIWPTGMFFSINIVTHCAVYLFNCGICCCNQLLMQSGSLTQYTKPCRCLIMTVLKFTCLSVTSHVLCQPLHHFVNILVILASLHQCPWSR
jgi:hypothetical protein